MSSYKVLTSLRCIFFLIWESQNSEHAIHVFSIFFIFLDGALSLVPIPRASTLKYVPNTNQYFSCFTQLHVYNPLLTVLLFFLNIKAYGVHERLMKINQFNIL